MLADAALRPVLHAGRRWWLVFGLLLTLVLIGAAAYGTQLVHGLGVTGKNDQVFWALYTTSLVSFIGFSYGGALVSAILRLTGATWRGPVVRISETTALATLLVGALFPVIHLGHPERVWEFFVTPQFNSPIVWDVVAITTYLLATVVLFGLPLVADLGILSVHPALGPRRRRLYHVLSFGWRGSRSQRRHLENALTVVAILIVPLAIVVHTVLSYAFSLTSRPGWHSTIFGPYFVIGAIYSGVAVVVLATVLYRHAYHLENWIPAKVCRNLGYVMVALAIAYGYATFTELTTEGYVSEVADAAVLYTLVLERYAALFWGFVLLGLVVPVVIVAIPRTRTPGWIAVGSICVICAMYVKRFLITVPPLTRPLLGGETATYTPTLVEMGVVTGAAAGICLIVMLVFRIFPILAVYEIQEIEEQERAAAARLAPPPASASARAGS
jgi:molybdopterin-containing oxidoreductase family membrane subunit